MSVFADFRAERLIRRLSRLEDLDGPEGRALLSRLASVAAAAVPRLLQSLEGTAGEAREGCAMELLRRLADDDTLPLFLHPLRDAPAPQRARITQVLACARGVDPHRVARALRDPELPRAALLEVLEGQRERLDADALLRLAPELDAASRGALFRLIREVADARVLPDLINRASGKDPAIRRLVMEVLGRFPEPRARSVLQEALRDDDPGVRRAALQALLAQGARDLPLGALCTLLRDGDLTVQQKAVDAVVRRNDPDTPAHLLPLLGDASEYVRRAAVEVLNGIGNSTNIKQLLVSIRDEDWWVRARSADALARIGGPRVVQAVVQLLRDEDEFVRRAAVEILNATRDETALTHLLAALEDTDWWVRERAVDALAAIGNRAAVPALLGMLQRDREAAPLVIRALARLGDDRAVPVLLQRLQDDAEGVRTEAVHALAELADAGSVGGILTALRQSAEEAGGEWGDLARDTADRLEARFAVSASRAGGADKATVTALAGDDTEGRALAGRVVGGPGLDVDALAPGDLLGERYRFVRRVGRGAFGSVLLMEDVMIGERIILKVMNPRLATDEEMIRRFVQELRLSRRITHENVIRIFDFLSVGGDLAISMEYFPSQTLAALLRQRAPLPQGQAVRHAAAVAAGMAAAHEVGVIHRDLKPGNVLINEHGLVKIVDFGIAAVTGGGDTRLTRTGILVGTPRYMAPEQATGGRVTASADIYALGVVLYEMLTGRPPFEGEDQIALVYQHVQGRATPPAELNPAIDPRLNALVLQMMAVEPAARPASMGAVRAALLESIQGAHPPAGGDAHRGASPGETD
ncbi:HEAT repeat domain-containing protein [Ectothiorhodospira mobilis]|uniref:HEAT repeat domain-containing protein n=1 Tax=Ectothiorhodospira mobilis TaxID=195064 RepID=UPI001EE7D0A6|nr:HEAT repeat domain-containing protein [Ectothiorhodospira mobilis]MCG5534596.1 HEAT repeat domain-containing protein [Ectothiorhodospira mobilis]